MSEVINAPEAHKRADERPHEHKKEVKITINGKHYEVREGLTSVNELKKIGHIPLADVLAKVVHGQLHPLPNEGEVHIRAGEVFVSHPPECASS